VLNFAPAGRFL